MSNTGDNNATLSLKDRLPTIPKYDSNNPLMTGGWLNLVEDALSDIIQEDPTLTGIAFNNLDENARQRMDRSINKPWPEFRQRLLECYSPEDEKHRIQVEIKREERYILGDFRAAIQDAEDDRLLFRIRRPGPGRASYIENGGINYNILCALSKRVPDTILESRAFNPTGEFDEEMRKLKQAANDALCRGKDVPRWITGGHSQAFVAHPQPTAKPKTKPLNKSNTTTTTATTPTKNSKPRDATDLQDLQQQLNVLAKGLKDIQAAISQVTSHSTSNSSSSFQ